MWIASDGEFSSPAAGADLEVSTPLRLEDSCDSAPRGHPHSDWDCDCFTAAILPHVECLLAVARRILGSEDLAWDAVQEALLSLWGQEELPPNPRAWLIRTVVNRSLHLARSRSRRRKHEKRASARRPEGSHDSEPSRILENTELRSKLHQALAELGQDHRAVFVMREVDQLDYQSIAERLNVPVGTVRSRLNRSRVLLKDILRRMMIEIE